MSDSLPNFFILGAAKCGTTSLYKYLDQHPSIFFPQIKEPQFFCNDELFSKGLDFYQTTFFRNSGGFKARGDATPQNLYFQKSARRIEACLPADSHRFIVVLRDPVERAYSHYRNMLYEGYEELDFAEALLAETERTGDSKWDALGTIRYNYYSAGLYAEQLERYFEIFPQDRFLILFIQDFSKDPVAVLESVFTFLGIDSVAISLDTKHNKSARSRLPRVQSFIRQPNRLRHALGKFLPYNMKAGIARRIIAMNSAEADYEAPDFATAERLRLRFLPDIERLEKITGRSLTEWKHGSNYERSHLDPPDIDRK